MRSHQEYGAGHESYARPDRDDDAARFREHTRGIMYRFTADDEARIARAVRAVHASWGSPDVVPLELFDALVRAGARAIDCWTSDLRATELAWISRQCSALLTLEEVI